MVNNKNTEINHEFNMLNINKNYNDKNNSAHINIVFI